jgi:hypothetical protein
MRWCDGRKLAVSSIPFVGRDDQRDCTKNRRYLAFVRHRAEALAASFAGDERKSAMSLVFRAREAMVVYFVTMRQSPSPCAAA